jgi:signal transduction histidine kinase
MREQLARTLAELRELARGLHPHELTDNGLAAAVTSLAEESALPVELSLEVGRLPEEVEAALYFVVAEALANAVKYAAASRMTVAVTVNPTTARVEVTDDGAGGADPDRGTGLRGLADRLEALGGVLRVQTAPEHGTRVSGEVPLDGP